MYSQQLHVYSERNIHQAQLSQNVGLYGYQAIDAEHNWGFLFCFQIHTFCSTSAILHLQYLQQILLKSSRKSNCCKVNGFISFMISFRVLAISTGVNEPHVHMSKINYMRMCLYKLGSGGTDCTVQNTSCSIYYNIRYSNSIDILHTFRPDKGKLDQL